jgi:hypothetical protein
VLVYYFFSTEFSAFMQQTQYTLYTSASEGGVLDPVCVASYVFRSLLLMCNFNES